MARILVDYQFFCRDVLPGEMALRSLFCKVRFCYAFKRVFSTCQNSKDLR